MPRPSEAAPLRRILEQAIMWIVLAGTIGAATLVNLELKRLGPAVTFDRLTLQLPRNWGPTRDEDDDRIVRRERGPAWFARTITVTHFTPSLSLQSLFVRFEPLHSEQVSLPDGAAAKITVIARPAPREWRQEGINDELQVLAVITPQQGQAYVISVRQLSFDPQSDVQRNVELIRRILQTVRFESR